MAEGHKISPRLQAESPASSSSQLASEGSDSPPKSPSREQFVGNLCNHISLPERYVGQICKGCLVFDASFEGGNLGRVDYISATEYDLFIRPDTCNPRYRVWFNFTVGNVQRNQRVIFNVVNFSKTKSLYREGMTPLVRSTSRPNWNRLPATNVFYYRSPDHHKHYVLSFAFAFDREGDVYQFSYSYTYGYTRSQHHLDWLESQHFPYLSRELLCYSVQQRRAEIVTITNPKNLPLKEPRTTPRKMVFITSRVHPGETPTSYVCQGLIDFLSSDSPKAKALRDHVVFKIVPMLNPDGVYLGNYRCSLMGFDLNRHWHEPSPWAHPTVYATKLQLMQYDKDPNIDLEFYIDIHAHSTLTNAFIYGNVYESEERLERHMIFPRLLSEKVEDFSWRKTSFNNDSVKAGTGRRFLGGCLGPKTNCYTLEVSFFGSKTGDVHIPYTEDDYMELGKNLALTFLDYYKLTDVSCGAQD